MEIVKEKMKLPLLVGHVESKTTVETDTVVPDTKPDVKAVPEAEAVCVIDGIEVQKNRVLIYGTVEFYVMYLSETDELKSLVVKTTYSDVVDINGAEPGMPADVGCKMFATTCKLLNGRKLSLKADFSLMVSVYRENESEFVTDVFGDGVEKRVGSVAFLQKNPTYRKNIVLNEKVEIARDMPAIYEVLRVIGKIGSKSYKIINGKVVVKADLDLVILYIDAELLKPCSATLSVPFTEILDMEGITEDWYFSCDLEPLTIGSSVGENEEGQLRLVDIGATILVTVQAARGLSMPILEDCYSIYHDTKLKKEKIITTEEVARVSTQRSVKGKMDLGDAPEIDKVYSVVSQAAVQSVEAREEGALVKGMADVTLMYITKEEVPSVYAKKQSFPFEELVACDLKPGDNADIDAVAYGFSYTLEEDGSIGIRGNMELKGLITRSVEQRLIQDVEMGHDKIERHMPSVTVCFVQEDDSLWEIAKHYSTSVSSIMEVNGLTEGSRLAGRKLIVPKYR